MDSDSTLYLSELSDTFYVELKKQSGHPLITGLAIWSPASPVHTSVPGQDTEPQMAPLWSS